MKTSKINKGFSLVELLVVVTIIAILSVSAYVALGGQTVKARDSKRMQNMDMIQSSLELYFIDFNRYPETLENGEATPAAGWKVPKKYLSTIPEDPNGEAFEYTLSADKQTYELAATLENDGLPTGYSTHVTGNSDTPLAETTGTRGKFLDGEVLSNCTAGQSLTTGAIGTSNADGNCVPYDPS